MKVLLFILFPIFCFSQTKTKSNYGIPTERGDLELYMFTPQEVDNLLNRISELEDEIAIIKGQEPEGSLPSISKTLSDKILKDLENNKATTISNKYSEEDLIIYGISVGEVKEVSTLKELQDYKQAHRKIDLIEKLKKASE